MEDLKEKIIYLQDELIQCLKQINYLEKDKRGIESIKNSEIEKLKKEITELKLEKMQREFYEYEGKNEEYSCDTIAETTAPPNYSLPIKDFTSSNNNCDIAGKRSIEC